MIDLSEETVSGTSDLTRPGADNSLTTNPRFSLIHNIGVYSQVHITKKILFFVIFAFILLGCAPVERKEQPAHKELIQLDGDGSLGQTFLSPYDGLSGISVYLKPSDQKTGELRLELLHNQIDTQVLRKATLDIDQVSTPGFHNFSFPPIKDSFNEDYHLSLTFSGPENISIGSAPGKVYLNGALYENGNPQNAQLAFNLEYSPPHLFLGLVREALYWLGLLSAGLLLVAIPGWAALSWLFPPWSALNRIAKLGLAIGLGIAFYPVLFLWTDTIGIQLGSFYALLLPLSGLIFIILRSMLDYREQGFSVKGLFSKPDDITEKENLLTNIKTIWIAILPDLVFLVVIALIVFTRFWPIRTLDAPMWGDSYQHTLITQLIVENGGLFTSWEPHAQLESFTYHFGFHSLAAAFQWLTNMSVIQSTLWVGQLVNIFAIIALYPLAVIIGKNKWAGVFAIIIAGLISPMPMYYVNWGRYTQMAGQVILPAVIVIIWLNLDSKQVRSRWNSLIWLGLAGLSLTHYRVLMFIPLFYLSFLILQFRELNAQSILKRTSLHATGTLILILPWAIRVFKGNLPTIIVHQIGTPAAQISQAVRESNAIGDISFYLPMFLWILMLFSVIWGIWRHNRKSIIFSLWWILILLAANPQWFQLPGSGILTNFAIFIAAYIPASVLIGSSAASVFSDVGILYSEEQADNSKSEPGINRRRFIFWSGIISITLFSIGLWYVRPRIKDVQPAVHALLTRPDLRAGKWITRNLPLDAKLLVNSFFAYGGSSVVGSDGGWWLPLTSVRQTTQPPLTYVSEAGLRKDYVAYTNELIALIETLGLTHPDVLEELRDRGVTHVYIGQQQGTVNGPPLLDVQNLRGNPNFQTIYHEDRVWIFEFIY